MKKLIIASTSTIYGSGYLEYLLPELKVFFKEVTEILFIPYARPSGINYDAYTKVVQDAFLKMNITVRGIHTYDDPVEAIKNAQAIFTGGGNTFVLVHTLYQNNLMQVLKETVTNGTPYLGTSAGSNIVGLNMKTTNDMPIVYPSKFETLGLVPFNINPHYLDIDKKSKHKGETRATRIKEFHAYNSISVLGLREGSWLEVYGDTIYLRGSLTARLFRESEKSIEIKPGKLDF